MILDKFFLKYEQYEEVLKLTQPLPPLKKPPSFKKGAFKNLSLIRRGQYRTFTFQKRLFYLLQWKPIKGDEKCFLFRLFGHVEVVLSERQGYFKIYDVTAWPITIDILPNMWRSKDNQKMKFGQVIEVNK